MKISKIFTIISAIILGFFSISVLTSMDIMDQDQYNVVKEYKPCMNGGLFNNQQYIEGTKCYTNNIEYIGQGFDPVKLLLFGNILLLTILPMIGAIIKSFEDEKEIKKVREYE